MIRFLASTLLLGFRRRKPRLLEEARYPSNILTMARLLLLPLVLGAMERGHRRRALALMALAMATDALDGPIARHRREVSDLGKLLDPVADKLLLDTAALALARRHGFPWWAMVLLLGRDATILLGGLLVYRRKATITTANPAGKLTTVALTGALLLYIADGPRTGRPALYVAMVPFVASMVAYMRSFLEDMRS